LSLEIAGHVIDGFRHAKANHDHLVNVVGCTRFCSLTFAFEPCDSMLPCDVKWAHSFFLLLMKLCFGLGAMCCLGFCPILGYLFPVLYRFSFSEFGYFWSISRTLE
jgi:hypothetical protein